MHVVFFVCALTSIAAVVLICLFLFANGIPAMKEIGLLNFLTGAKWKPGNDIYGILPMILGSIYITAGAVIMILPTIIGVSEAALRAVPSAYSEGAVAMGARHERAIFTVMLPAAKSGVLAGIVLGIGRAIGETMAVIMVAGNQPRLTGNMLKGIRTMTANIVLEMGYATGLHREALIATGVVLFVFILIINLTFSVLKRRKQA